MLSVLYSWQPSSGFSTNGTSWILSHHSRLFLLSSKSCERSQTLWNGLSNTFAQQRCSFCLRKSGVHLPFNSSHSLPHLFIEVNRVRLSPKNSIVHSIVHHCTVPMIKSFPAAFFGHHFTKIGNWVRNHHLQEVIRRGPGDSILIHAQLEVPKGQDFSKRSSAFRQLQEVSLKKK